MAASFAAEVGGGGAGGVVEVDGGGEGFDAVGEGGMVGDVVGDEVLGVGVLRSATMAPMACSPSSCARKKLGTMTARMTRMRATVAQVVRWGMRVASQL